MGRRPFTGLKAETKAASGVIRYKLTVDPPLQDIGVMFERLGLSAKAGFAEVWDRLIPHIIGAQRRLWLSRGAAVDASWPPLSAEYARRLGVSRAATLALTGAVRDIVTSEAGVMKVHPNYLRFGVRAPGAAKHQFGNKSQGNKHDAIEPARVFLAMTPELQGKAQDLLSEYIAMLVRESGLGNPSRASAALGAT